MQSNTNIEHHLRDDDVLISTTDTNSIITYADEKFTKISGYTNEELIGKPHNLVRHADMPSAVFKDMWEHIKNGNTWMGIVKNRRKDGGFYWVNALVSPIKNQQGQIVEYQSVRTKARPDDIRRAEKMFGELNSGNTLSSVMRKRNSKFSIVSIIAGLSSSLPFVGGAFLDSSPNWHLGVEIGMFGAIYTTIHYLMMRKFKKVNEAASRIVTSDITEYLYFDKKDETTKSQLATMMSDKTIQAVSARISDSINMVNSNVDNLTNYATDTTSIVSNQQTETDTVASASEEMLQTSNHISEVITSTVEMSSSAYGRAQEASEVASNATDNIVSLRGQILKTKDTFSEVEQITTEVAKVSEGTTSTSDNMNHVNASINDIGELTANLKILSEQFA